MPTYLGPETIWKRTPYDAKRAAELIRDSGMPGAVEFAEENVLCPPSPAEAAAVVEQATGN